LSEVKANLQDAGYPFQTQVFDAFLYQGTASAVPLWHSPKSRFSA